MVQLEKVQAQKNTDGASSGVGQGAWDFALTGTGEMLGVDGLAWGAGYGEAENGSQATTAGENHDDEHFTGFINYSAGPVTLGYQQSHIANGAVGGTNQTVDAWGIAVNVNENLSVSYGERDVEFDKAGAAVVTENGEGIAVAYTMGSMKIAGNRNEVSDNNGSAGSNDEMTEIALSFAF